MTSLRERLASLEHEQWMIWSKSLALEVSPGKLSRWRKLWVPYQELREEDKQLDRVWADKILEELEK